MFPNDMVLVKGQTCKGGTKALGGTAQREDPLPSSYACPELVAKDVYMKILCSSCVQQTDSCYNGLVVISE